MHTSNIKDSVGSYLTLTCLISFKKGAQARHYSVSLLSTTRGFFLQTELPYGGNLAGKSMSAADTRDLCQSLDEQALQEVLGGFHEHIQTAMTDCKRSCSLSRVNPCLLLQLSQCIPFAALREQSGSGANGRGYTSQLASMQEELHQNVTAKDSLAAELQELREKLKVLHFQPLSRCSVGDQMIASGSKGFFEKYILDTKVMSI